MKNLHDDFRKYLRSRNPYQMTAFDSMVQKQNIITPYITKESQDRMIQVDVFSELMANRIIYFGEGVTTETAGIALSQLLYMHSVDKTAPISMYISSPGGEVYTGLALYDTMQLVEQDLDITTICCGIAASMGSILLVGGTNGKRMALQHSRIMIHSVSTGSDRITYPDLDILAKETGALQKELLQIISDKTGKSYEEVEKDCSRDCWLKAEDGLPGKYGPLGIIDKVVDKL
jgi:ATP-dependent Clp protease protease subunit